MNQDEIETIAFFRYDLIRPLINNNFPDEGKQAYLRWIAETERGCQLLSVFGYLETLVLLLEVIADRPEHFWKATFSIEARKS